MHEDHDALARLDREHVWHPYTQMAEYNERDPLVVVEAEGRKLKDAEGDNSDNSANVFGRQGEAPTRVALAAIHDQARNVLQFLGQFVGSCWFMFTADKCMNYCGFVFEVPSHRRYELENIRCELGCGVLFVEHVVNLTCLILEVG